MTIVSLPNRVSREVALTENDCARFGALLLDRCGLYFSHKRRAELELGIRQAFAASTCADLDEYYRLLQRADGGSVEMDQLINAVTVSETHFFRNTAQFDALFYHALPQMIERRRPLRTLRIWSAGCASGEEPYSIAMLLRELLPDVEEWAITILGTDINTAALDRARKAVYGEWAFREERAKAWRPRYFRPFRAGGNNRYELIPQVRRMVTFAKLNLAEPCYPSCQTNTTLIDMIACRNVTIYFGESVIAEVIERFYNALTDGGWLVVGHSEPSLVTYRRFQTCNFPNTILYQRTGQPTIFPAEWNWITPSQAADFAIGAPPVAATPPPPPVAATPPPPPVAATPPPPPVAATPPPPPVLATEPIRLAPDVTPVISPSKDQDPLDHAQELLEYGHSEQARDVLLNLVSAQPGHALACALLGQTYANLGCWQEAERWCRQATQHDKLALKAYYTLALVLQHQGDLDQAIGMMKKVVYIDRNYVLGHFGLANLYHDNRQWPQAQKSLDNARRLLEACSPEELIPGSGGVTAGRLQETIVRQQQAWSGESEK